MGKGIEWFGCDEASMGLYSNRRILLIVCWSILAAPGASVQAQPDPAFEAAVLQDREQHHQIVARILKTAAVLPPPVSRDQWQALRTALREKILEEVVFRGVPPSWLSGPGRVDPAEVISTECGYRIRKLRYEAVPGLWIPAVLYEPEGAPMQRPAVLHFQGHVGPSGKATSYIQQLNHKLAQRGYLVLSPDWPGHGELSGTDYYHNRLAHLNLAGTSGLAVFYLTARRAFDYLSRHPEVDSGRIAVTGLSGGGWQTIILSALDDRVALAAPNAGFIGLSRRIKISNIGDLEQNATDLHQWADYTHLAALLPPRPSLFIYNAKDECCFPAAEAEPSVVNPIRPFFRLFDSEDKFAYHVNHEPGTHNYEKDNQDAFLSFLEKHMRFSTGAVQGDGCRPTDGVLPEKSLAVGNPKANATFRSLALDLLRERSHGQLVPDRNELEAVIRFDPVVLGGSVLSQWSDRGRQSRVWKLEGGGFSVPAVEIIPNERTDECTVFIISDAGRTTARGRTAELLGRGCRVVALDLLLHGTGEGRVHGPAWYDQLLGTVGLRSIGIQAAQLLGAVNFYSKDAEQIRLEAYGRRSSLAALVAAALRSDKLTSLFLHGLPESLVQVVKDDVFYNDEPELFCFGVLKRFDVPVLVRLASPAEVHLR